MKKELRDTIIAFSGILVSLSAGVWTLFNYNVNQENAELDTIYIISSEISSLEFNFCLGFSEMEVKVEKEKQH